MINETYLHPVRTSDYSNIVSPCHGLTCSAPSNKNSPHSKLKHTSRNIFQLPFLSSEIFYPPHPIVLKIFKLTSFGDKKKQCEYNIFF